MSKYLLKVSGQTNARLNNSADDLILTVLGSSQLPRVEFEKSCISFSPTNIGRKELRPVVILNLSGIPVSFSWNIPLKLSRVFSMTPMKGYLQGMERLQVSCTFCPQNDVRYISEVTCVVTALTEEAFYHDHSINIAHKSSDLETRVSLKITAAGVRAVITVEPKTLDFGVQRVGAAHTRKLTLYNSTEGVLEYSLKCFPMGDLKEETYEINFDNPHGLVHALSFEEVIVSMKAYKALTFGAQIICLTDGAGSEELNFTCQKEATDSASRLAMDESCLLSAIAAYPSVIISGIRSDRLSTVQLWKQIQVDKLNDLLTNCSIDPSRRLTQPQMLFGLGTPLENSFPFIFEFGAQNIGCLATIIDIVLECHVALPVVWKIRTWNDKEVDMGHWVEEGDPTKEESTLLTIRSMKLFEIEPSQGYLEPLQRMLVRFTYKHAIGGCHSIPVSFEVENGYSIDITLSGKTLPISHKILGLQAASCTLDPIVVGQMNLVLQTFEIRNDGLLEFEYRLDTTPLEELQRQNFGFKVLWCLNASGSIPPMKTVLLQWLFQPLEVRVYALDIPILIDEGESLVLHLEGVGLPPSSEHKSVKGGAHRSHHQISSQSGKVFSWPGVPVALSTDFIDLGRVPELSSKEKLLTVHNLLETYAITFFWRSTLATEKSIDGKLSVFPQSGIVKPGRSCLCKIKIVVGTELQDFLVTLKCDVNVINEENRLNVFQRHPKERKLSNSLCEEVIACNRKRLGTESSSRKFWHSCVPHAFTETLKSAMPSKVSTSVNDYPIPFKTLYLSVACAISGFSKDPGTPKCLLQASHLLHKMVPCNSIKSLKNIKFDFVKSFLLELLRESVCEAVIKTPTVVNKNACLYFEQLQSNQVIGGETESSSFQSNNLQYAPNDDIVRDGIPTGISYENKYVKPPHANEIPVALSNPKVDCLSRSCQYASENELDKSFLSNSMIMTKAVLEDAIFNVISGLINDDYTLLLKG